MTEKKTSPDGQDPQLVTFGCRLNSYESEVMRDHAKNAGLENAIIFNTCAVTAEAERQARQSIRRARRDNPDAKIIVTGCAAQVAPQKWGDMAEVDQVVGNDEKMKFETWKQSGFAMGGTEAVQVNDIMSVKETANHLIQGFEGHTRAFVQVQNGCNHRCTFCIIPFGRGNSRSVPLGEVVSQARRLVEEGYSEIVLSGVDISSYGEDLPGRPTLGQMIRRMLAQIPDLKRLRISSIDSVEIDEDLWRLIAEEERLMPHLHLSLQHGDDLILKRMKRRHLREHAIDICQKARSLRPDIVFGADLIAGFPTETEEMFENMLRAVDECGLTWLHVFPYSERPGTPAARMPQVEKAIRKERAKRLRAKGDEIVASFLASQVGCTISALAEKEQLGHSQHFAEVKFTHAVNIGSIVPAKVIGVDGKKLIAEPLEK